MGDLLAVGQLNDDNHDGKVDDKDLPDVVTRLTLDTIGIFLSNGDGSFRALPAITIPPVAGFLNAPITPIPLDIKLADFNGDGRPDLLVTTSRGPFTTDLSESGGRAGWVHPTPARLGGPARAVRHFPALRQLDAPADPDRRLQPRRPR